VGGVIATLAVWALVVLAILSAAGRFRVVAVSAHGSEVHLASGSVGLVEPVSSLQLKEGDVFLAQPRAGGTLAYYKVSSIDSWTHGVTTRDAAGNPVSMRLGNQTWRLVAAVPVLGRVLHVATGPVQAGLFVIVGLLLIARAEMLRHPRHPRRSSVTPSTA
jgi:hypothetical protein